MTTPLTTQLRRLRWEAPLGPLSLWAWGDSLVRVDFPGHNDLIADPWAQRYFHMQAVDSTVTDDLFSETIRQLEGYFSGAQRSFDLPVALHGTPFQQQVWRAVSTVPWGATSTYRAIAMQIGQPNAVRAVGAANGANPLSIIVPCHRLLGSDGSLRGYGGGLERKEQLLALEGMRRGNTI